MEAFDWNTGFFLTPMAVGMIMAIAFTKEVGHINEFKCISTSKRHRTKEKLYGKHR